MLKCDIRLCCILTKKKLNEIFSFLSFTIVLLKWSNVNDYIRLIYSNFFYIM